jgi:hypothetical protein
MLASVSQRWHLTCQYTNGNHKPRFLTERSGLFGLIAREHFEFEIIAMIKERITASDLAKMITAKIGAAGLEIAVRKDHAFGFQPMVISAPGDLIGYQRRAEEIAHRLRAQFDLCD